MVTIGLVANVFNEANALPGWLETHTPFFDDVRVVHAGPRFSRSNDGTMEVLEKWNIPVKFCSIDDGFGVVRTEAIHFSPCDWVMLLDADERFFPVHRIMVCSGESTPHSEVSAILQTYDFHDLKTMIPNWENVARLGAKLNVHFVNTFDQGAYLREVLDSSNFDSVACIRRHWHDFSFKRPTQNWHTDPDWQMRLVRNKPSIFFDPGTKVHERMCGVSNVLRADDRCGPFFDHFHFTFKRMEQEQRAHDIAIYDSIHAGGTPPTWEEFNK